MKFNQKNNNHKLFIRDKVYFIWCKLTGGEYNASIKPDKCLCCGEIFK